MAFEMGWGLPRLGLAAMAWSLVERFSPKDTEVVLVNVAADQESLTKNNISVSQHWWNRSYLKPAAKLGVWMVLETVAKGMVDPVNRWIGKLAPIGHAFLRGFQGNAKGPMGSPAPSSPPGMFTQAWNAVFGSSNADPTLIDKVVEKMPLTAIERVGQACGLVVNGTNSLLNVGGNLSQGVANGMGLPYYYGFALVAGTTALAGYGFYTLLNYYFPSVVNRQEIHQESHQQQHSQQQSQQSAQQSVNIYLPSGLAANGAAAAPVDPSMPGPSAAAAGAPIVNDYSRFTKAPGGANVDNTRSANVRKRVGVF